MQPKNKEKKAKGISTQGSGRCEEMRWSEREFPGGPAVRAPHLHCRDLDWNPGQGTKSLYVMWPGPQKEDDTREPTQAFRPTGQFTARGPSLYETQNLIFSMHTDGTVKA